jgi:hypothetical protein
MGNAVTQSAYLGAFQDFEHIYGKMLIKGIRENDPKQVEDAIAVAKKEFARPVKSNSVCTLIQLNLLSFNIYYLFRI